MSKNPDPEPNPGPELYHLYPLMNGTRHLASSFFFFCSCHCAPAVGTADTVACEDAELQVRKDAVANGIQLRLTVCKVIEHKLNCSKSSQILIICNS